MYLLFFIVTGPNAYFTNNIYGMNQQQEGGGAGQPNEFSTFRPPPLPPNSVTTPTTVIPSSTSALPLYTNQYFASYYHMKEMSKKSSYAKFKLHEICLQNLKVKKYRRYIFLYFSTFLVGIPEEL